MLVTTAQSQVDNVLVTTAQSQVDNVLVTTAQRQADNVLVTSCSTTLSHVKRQSTKKPVGHTVPCTQQLDSGEGAMGERKRRGWGGGEEGEGGSGES